MVQSHSVVLVSNHSAEPSTFVQSDQVDHDKDQKSSDQGSEVAQEEETQQAKLTEPFEGR